MITQIQLIGGLLGAALLALAMALPVLGSVRQPGNLVAGLEGIQEQVSASATITESSTSGVITLSLSGDYDGAPEVVGLSLSRENPSSGDASSFVDGYDIDRAGATADAIDVTAHLDAAPGTGEQVDVRADAWVSGDANK